MSLTSRNCSRLHEAAGAASFVADVKAGNVKDAVIDGLGIIADAAAVALPCIPGGAGAAIKAARAVGGVANVAGGALSVQDGLENGNYIEAGLGAVQVISGVGQLSNVLSTGSKVSDASTKTQHGYEIYNTKTEVSLRLELVSTIEQKWCISKSESLTREMIGGKI